jgi:Uma2 family endonuclease
MIQARQQPISFDEFIAWYPENSEVRYELRNGVIVEMPKARGQHSEVSGMLVYTLMTEIVHNQLPDFTPKECVIRSLDGESGYEPDVIVINRQTIENDPKWAKESVITQGESAALVIEVVSTNWRDDYHKKFADYEALGIPEYWIVDYLGRVCSEFCVRLIHALRFSPTRKCFSGRVVGSTSTTEITLPLGLGGRRYIGSPKQPTLSVYTLVDGEYEGQQFRGSDRILSPTFPNLTLTPEQVFSAGS